MVDVNRMGNAVLNQSKPGGQPRDAATAHGGAAVQPLLGETEELGHAARASEALASEVSAASVGVTRTTQREGTSSPIIVGFPGGMASSAMQRIGGGQSPSGSATCIS